MSYIIAVAARWIISVKFIFLVAVHTVGLAKNGFWLVVTQKKRIGEELNYFLNIRPLRFSWAKNKRKPFFSDGKSKDPLTERAAVKSFTVLSSLHLISPFSRITRKSLVVSFTGVSDWLFTI